MFFVFLSLVFGLVFVLITPPFQTPDEPVHFYRSYQVSTLNLMVDPTDAGHGGVLPESLTRTVTTTMAQPVVHFEPGAKYDIRKTYQALAISEQPNQTRAYNLAATAMYPPLSYAPQAVGIALTRLFDLAPVAMMYAGRLTNLISWVVLMAVAIRIMPYRKWVMVFIGLLPMLLAQAASLSADVLAIALVALFASCIFRLQTEKYIEIKQMILLLILGIVMSLSKQGMFIFLPLVLLLRNRQFAQKTHSRIAKIAIVIVPLIIMVLWILLNRDANVTESLTHGPSPAEQLRFIIHNPHSFINVLWNTHFFTWGDSVTTSLIGTFGWMDTPLAKVFVVAAYVLLFILLVGTRGIRDDAVNMSRRDRLFLAFIAFAYWGMINVALYLIYTPPEFKIVYGLQGRYFLPLLFVFIPLLAGGWLRIQRQAYQRLVRVGPLLLLCVSILTVFYRYYVRNV